MAKTVRPRPKSRETRSRTSIGSKFFTTNCTELLAAVRKVIANLDRDKRERHRRHVSVGDLLTDRWQIARDYGFGEGTSCYDNVLILGDVVAGRNCWIGPNVILDGLGGLSIGDYVDISAGVQIYTHDTVKRVRSGGTEPVEYAPTRIGSRVYIGPQSVIQRGVTIGDDVTIGAMSFVNRDVPRGTTVWGIPARPPLHAHPDPPKT
jgi:acetyltransferase-like isoleucine patch superfamily enzyme